MNVLVLNCGSSSLKFQLVDTDLARAAEGTDRVVAKGVVEDIGGGLPYLLYERHGIRRYGFHGTSHRYASRRLSALMQRRPDEEQLHLVSGRPPS